MFSKIKRFLIKINKKLPALAFDLLAIPAAWYVAFWLRFNMTLLPNPLITKDALIAFCLLLGVQIFSYYYFKVYRGLWRFSSIDDVTRIIKSVFAAILLLLPLFYLTSTIYAIPRSIMPLYAINLISLLCSARLLLRYFKQNLHKSTHALVQRVLIIGAGEAGESLVRDLKRTRAFFPVGMIDDNIKKRGMEIHGVPVIGSTDNLVRLVQAYAIDLIFIAIPSANSATMRRIVGFCEQSKVTFRTLPSFKDLASGLVEINALREVNLEDLLGREEVHLDWTRIAHAVDNKRILVTGGGGSIGSELCRQLIALNPSKLMIIDNSDFNLYQIEMELKTLYPKKKMAFLLASITDRVAIEAIFSRFKPDLVFHAAAYKHVPMLENQIRIAVLNNIMGTKIVAEEAVRAHAEKFILISTDKAVNPTSVMGTTKRIAEIYCQNSDKRVKTRFITVRFGNVLDSAGSVIPLFKKQLKAGGPITVTHPDIQRYFMTIPEACRLILQAMVCGDGGEIFVLDMGLPIKISYLAEQLIRLSGKEPGKDIGIIYTGLRPGEKLYEELFHAAETLTATEHNKLFKASVRQLDWQELNSSLLALEKTCLTNDIDNITILLRNLVPEYKSSRMKIQVAKEEIH